MTIFNDDQKLEILKDLVAIKSVNGDEKEVAEYIQKLFKKYGIESELTNINGNRANLIAEIGSGHPVLAITGHMDVVSPGNLDDWKTDPFEMTEKDGILYGRGVNDMKSGLAAIIITMIELHDQGLPKKGTIRLLATLGEEVGEEGSAAFEKDGQMDDVDGLIVGEPTGLNIAYAQKGSLDLRVKSKGKASHSSMPAFGYNAVDALMNFLTEATNDLRNNHEGDSSMGPFVFNTTTIKGGTQVNSIPDFAEAEVNARTIPEYDNKKVMQTLNDLAAKYNQNGAHISFETIMDEGPVSGKKDNILAKLTSEAMKQYSDGPVTYVTDMFANIQDTMAKYQAGDIVILVSPGITDASNLIKNKSKDIPFVVAGPGNLSSHQVNEYLEKQMYFNYIDLYQKLSIQFLEQA